jgi:hypothetical protein
MHHDVLELPDGQLIFVTRLREGQFATVIQLPTAERRHEASEDKATEVAAAPATSG